MDILTSDVLVPVYGAYEYLVVSSVGLKRFNLLGSSSSSRAGMSSLGGTNFSSSSAMYKPQKVARLQKYDNISQSAQLCSLFDCTLEYLQHFIYRTGKHPSQCLLRNQSHSINTDLLQTLSEITKFQTHIEQFT